MVNKKIAEAQKLERKAGRLKRSSERYLTGPTHGEVSKLYERAGEAWYKLGEYHQSLKDFELASEYAYDERIRRKIRKRMEEIYKIEKTKYKKGLRKLGAIGKLEKRLAYGVLSIVSLTISLFFISMNITGYSIEIFDNAQTSLLIGIILFTLGLAFAFFYFKEKRKVKE